MSSKVALITGGSTGIGLATAKLLASNGYKLAIHGLGDKDVEDAASVCSSLSPHNHQPLELVSDFVDPENAATVVRKTIEHYGRLDALIFCAGLLKETNIENSNDFDIYQIMMRINMDAAVKATLAGASELKKSKGCLVFVSSVASKKALTKLYGYCTSKASLSMFAKCIAVELAPDVRVNVISPGIVRTALYNSIGLNINELSEKFKEFSLQGRLGEPEDIAASINFLISDEAKYIHGHELFADGGMLIKPLIPKDYYSLPVDMDSLKKPSMLRHDDP